MFGTRFNQNVKLHLKKEPKLNVKQSPFLELYGFAWKLIVTFGNDRETRIVRFGDEQKGMTQLEFASLLLARYIYI